MLYPVGWLAPELPHPAPLGPNFFSVSPDPQSALSRPPAHRQRTQVNGPALAEDGPRWAMGRPFLGNRHPQVAMTPAAAPGPVGMPPLASPVASTQTLMLRQGSQGDRVWTLQARLQRLGYDPGPLDGQFGPQTEQAVRQFQQASSLAVDGVVGPITWRYLVPGLGSSSGRDMATTFSPTLATQGMASAWSTPARSLSTHFSLHPMAVLPEDAPSQGWSIVVMGLGLAGLVAYLGFRPDAALPPQRWATTPPAAPVHAPQPIYPVSVSAGLSQPSEPPPALAAPLPLDPPPASTPSHLPNFVYDLLQPYDRHQVEVRLRGKTAAEDPSQAPSSQVPPMLAALLQRVGTFPEHNHRTGSPYTYVLLDDLGGCLRLCGNEIWLTHIAHHWFQPDVVYTALIRRIDIAGQVLDREFTVSLSRQQLAWVA